MGYQSTVALAVHSSRAGDFLRLLHKHGFSKTGITQNEEGDVLLYTSGKWYDGYGDVDAVMSFIKNLEPEMFHFVRVGEDLGDIERLGDLDAFDVNVHTVIECEHGGPPTWPADIELAEAVDESLDGDRED